VQADRALLRPVEAVDAIEQACLARPVRADDRVDLALPDRDGDVTERLDAAEPQGDVVDLELRRAARERAPVQVEPVFPRCTRRRPTPWCVRNTIAFFRPDGGMLAA
jgi:hypothetical protein